MLLPKPLQFEGIEALVARATAPPRDYPPHFALFDKMRVGKSVQSLYAAARLQRDYCARRIRVAVLCKAIGRDNWWEMRAAWVGKAITASQFWCESYQRFVRSLDVRRDLRRFQPDILILDECQMLRNRDAQITQLLYGPECDGGGFADCADIVWLLSGTPTDGNIGEIWPHLRALWGWPYDYQEHIDRFARYSIGDYGPRFYGVNKRTIKELSDFLATISLRRTFEQMNPDAGGPVWNTVALAAKRGLAEIRKLERDKSVRGSVTRALKNDLSDADANDDPHIASLARAVGLCKAALAVEYVESVFDGSEAKHVLVGAMHRHVIDAIATGLRAKGYRVLTLDGRNSRAETRDVKQQWMAGKAHVFIGQLRVCGTSIDLSRADACVLAETSWSPDDNVQFVARCQHITKTSAFPVDVLVLSNTLDESMQRVVARKGQTSSHLWSAA